MSLASAFARFTGGAMTLEALGVNATWAMRDVPAPGVMPDGAEEVDARFDAEPHYEQTGETRWGYCLVGGAAAVVSCESALGELAVPEQLGGCPVRVIGPRAFADMSALHALTLPEGIEEICSYAFLYAGLRCFDAPASLKKIGVCAFHSCRELSEIVLNDGLASIGREAFCGTAVSALELPASLNELGSGAISYTRIGFGEDACTLRLKEGSPFVLDERGALYRHGAQGLALAALLDKGCTSYAILEGTSEVLPRACADSVRLREVLFPQGLRFIGEAAFSGCTRLAKVELPETLEGIGPSAFKNCAIRHIVLPPLLAQIGYDAFVNTERVLHVPPVIGQIEVAEGNETFYVQDDMLCMRDTTGMGDVLLLYYGHGGAVTVPDSIGVIGPAAFAGQRNVRRLTLHDHIAYIDTLGFAFETAPYQVTFLHAGPNRADVVVTFPEGSRGASALHASFASGEVDAQLAMREADSAIFGAAGSPERFVLIANRLAAPLWLTPKAHELFVQSLATSFDKALCAYAEKGHLEGYDVMVDAGVLTGENFDEAMRIVAETGEVIAVNKLLDIRRGALAANAFEFDL